jgi:hypothetical protein
MMAAAAASVRAPTGSVARRSHHPAGGQLDFGLVVGHQLAAAQRMREFGLQARGQIFGFDCHPRPFSSVTTGLLILHTVTSSYMLS